MNRNSPFTCRIKKENYVNTNEMKMVYYVGGASRVDPLFDESNNEDGWIDNTCYVATHNEGESPLAVEYISITTSMFQMYKFRLG